MRSLGISDAEAIGRLEFQDAVDYALDLDEISEILGDRDRDGDAATDGSTTIIVDASESGSLRATGPSKAPNGPNGPRRQHGVRIT